LRNNNNNFFEAENDNPNPDYQIGIKMSEEEYNFLKQQKLLKEKNKKN